MIRAIYGRATQGLTPGQRSAEPASFVKCGCPSINVTPTQGRPHRVAPTGLGDAHVL